MQIIDLDTNKRVTVQLSSDFKVDLIELLKKFRHPSQDLAVVSVFRVIENREIELRTMPKLPQESPEA